MAEITGFTAARMLEIENNTIVAGQVSDGNLLLIRGSGASFDAGSVVGPKGDKGDTGGIAEAPNDGASYVRKSGLWAPITDDFSGLLAGYVKKYSAAVIGGPVGGTAVTLATITVPAVAVDSVLDARAFWTAYNTIVDNTCDFQIKVNGSAKAGISNRHESAVNERRPYAITGIHPLFSLAAGVGATVTVSAVRSASGGSGAGTFNTDTNGVLSVEVTPV